MASDCLKFYTILTLAGFGIAWASGIDLALIGFRGNPAECSSSTCLFGLILDVLGWLMVSVFGLRAFILFMTGPSRGPKSVESLETGSSIEDQKILEMLREQLSHKRVAKRVREVETLAWSNMQRWDYPRFKWGGLRKPSTFVVSAGLRGKLEVEDWRTFLGWVYHKHRTRDTIYVGQPVVRAMLPLLLAIGVALSVNDILGQYTSLLFGSIFGPPAIFIFLYRLGPAMRRLLLRNDSVAAVSLGNGRLLSMFEKIDMLQLRQVEEAKKRSGWAARLWPEPSITERIASLRRGSSLYPKSV